MELLLDIGNSRSKARLYHAGTLTEIQLENINAEQWSQIKAVYCASVAAQTRVQQVRDQIPAAIPFVQIQSEAQAFNVTNSYLQPQLLRGRSVAGVSGCCGLVSEYRSADS